MREDMATDAVAWAQRVGVFDLETTGVNVHRDRIVSAHVGVLDASGAVLFEKSWLADPGVVIPDQAAAVHGITTQRARDHGQLAPVVVREIVSELRALFAQNIPVVVYNASYDFSLLMAECLRYGVEPILAPHPVIDPLVLDKAYDRYRRGKRRLTEVAAHYEVALHDAHDAAADAHAAGRVALAIARRFDELVPRSAPELHSRQIEWARTQAAGLTDYFIRTGKIQADDVVDGSWPIRNVTADTLR